MLTRPCPKRQANAHSAVKELRASRASIIDSGCLDIPLCSLGHCPDRSTALGLFQLSHRIRCCCAVVTWDCQQWVHARALAPGCAPPLLTHCKWQTIPLSVSRRVPSLVITCGIHGPRRSIQPLLGSSLSLQVYCDNGFCSCLHRSSLKVHVDAQRKDIEITKPRGDYSLQERMRLSATSLISRLTFSLWARELPACLWRSARMLMASNHS